MNRRRKQMIVHIISVLVAESRKRFRMIVDASELDPEILQAVAHVVCSESIPKVRNFYEEVIPSYNFTTFKSHFRMSSPVFEVILAELAHCPEFQKRDQNAFGGPPQLCVEKTLLITLWTLGTPESYRSIGDRFGVAKSSVFIAVHLVVDVILQHLCKTFIKWPSEEERDGIAVEYSRYRLPNVIGAVDGCHIPIQKPSEHGNDYYNRKKFYSVVLQGICKSDLQFIDVDCRWPGSVHDARIFRTSDIFPRGPDLCAPHFYIIGDAAYPCRSWIMTPYRNNGHLTPAQVHFNITLSKTRVKIEHAFALLKGRFRRLRNCLEMLHIERIVRTTVACCVLHNICLLNNDEDVDAYLAEGMQEVELVFNAGDHDPDEEGAQLRTFLTQYLWNIQQQRN